MVSLIITILAIVALVYGVINIINGAILLGIILVIVGLLLGSYAGWGAYGRRGGPRL